MTYEEYLEQQEKLTKEELSNKRTHEEVMDGLERRHHQNVRKEMDMYYELRRKEKADYADKQGLLREQKRRLKMEYLTTRDPEETDTNAARIARQIGYDN